jgi:hypothetical protein
MIRALLKKKRKTKSVKEHLMKGMTILNQHQKKMKMTNQVST